MSGFDPPGGHRDVAFCRAMSYTVVMATTQRVPQLGADEVTWGDRLRRIRINRQLNQDELADALGVTKPTVGKYELLPFTPRNHRLVENVIELRFGRAAADFLRGSRQPTGSRVRRLHVVRDDLAVAS